MGVTTHFNEFLDWLDGCSEIGFEVADIKEDHKEYFFETDGHKIAYWDREHGFGYVVYEC
jgi:hypothetical protein